MRLSRPITERIALGDTRRLTCVNTRPVEIAARTPAIKVGVKIREGHIGPMHYTRQIATGTTHDTVRQRCPRFWMHRHRAKIARFPFEEGDAATRPKLPPGEHLPHAPGIGEKMRGHHL